MKIKTSETTLLQLNWLVANCKGYEAEYRTTDFFDNEVSPYVWILNWDIYPELSSTFFAPSTDWAQGGPIIEREKLDVLYMGDGIAEYYWRAEAIGGYTFAEGPTPLIAAMRCYVATKLGDEVEVPDELC